MNVHTIFYYPNASFTDTQVPLVNAVALHFDKLYLLDLVGASSGNVGDDYSKQFDIIPQLARVGVIHKNNFL